MFDTVIVRAGARRGTPAVASALSAFALLLATPAQAALVSACSGVSLPPSAVTGIMRPVLQGIVDPIQGDVNGILGIPLIGALGLPALNINLTGPGGLLTTADAGLPISLSVLKTDGTVLTSADTCNTTTDSIQLNTPQGIAIGGNQITGLGNGSLASAGQIDSIALGNNARTDALSSAALALGPNAVVGANSSGAIALGAGANVADSAAGGIALGNAAAVSYAGAVAIGSGSVTGSVAPTGTGFLTGQAAPAAEASFGAPGAPRRLTNIADGSAPSDAVSVAQLAAENAGRNALGAATAANLGGGASYNPANGTLLAPSYTVQGNTYATVGEALTGLDGGVTGNTAAITNLTTAVNAGTVGTVVRDPVTPGVLLLAGAGGTPAVPGTPQVLRNLANGIVAPGSTDAVTGDQLNSTNVQVLGNSAAIGANTTNINNLSTGLATGTIGLVQQAGGVPGGQLSVGATTGGAVVDFTGTGGPRTLSGVAPGVAATDAVNLGQAQGLATAAAGSLPIQYSAAAAPTTPTPGVASNDTTLVGAAAGAVALHNVAAGVVAAGSTDAVNGDQLATTNAQVTANTGAIGVNAAAISTNSAGIAGNTMAITSLTNGTTGLLQQAGGAPGGGQLTIGAATGGTSLSIAGTDGNRVLSGVAPGVAPTDAANVGQITDAVGTATANAVQYDAPGGVRSNTVTLAGGAPGAVTVTNVAPAALNDVSTDAVNGSQLFATNTQVSSNTTAITSLGTAVTAGTVGTVVRDPVTPDVLLLTGTGGTPGVPGTPQVLRNLANGTIAAGSTDAVTGDQLNSTNAQVAGNSAAIGVNTTNIGNLSTGLANGTIGLVQQAGGAPGSGQLTIGAATGGTSLSIAGTDGNRVLSGVAPGVAPTDAANVGQITDAVGTATANAVQYDAPGGVRSNTVTLAGGAAGPVTVTNVAPAALGASSTDAVNGSQLFATNTQVSSNTTAITSLTNGTAGIVQQASPSAAVTVAAASGGTTVDFTGTSGPRTLSGVAAGVVTTDAVNLGQAQGLIAASAGASPIQYSAAAAPTTPTPGVASNDTTLVGAAAGAVALHNVAAGVVATGSNDAVNGGQLAATNGQVAANTSAIAGNTTAIATNTANIATNTANIATNTSAIAGNTTAITNLTNGTAGLVQQAGGAPGNGQITVGAATGGTSVSLVGTAGNRTLTGLKDGINGSDAVTVAQINNLTGGQLNVVQYDTAADGGRSNTISLAGGAPGGVAINNVAAAPLTATSTGAVNGGQLYATNTNVSLLLGGQAGAFQANNAAAAAAPVASGANAVAGGYGASATGAGDLALGAGATSTGTGSVAIGQGSSDGGATRVVSVGSAGNERRVTNVAPALNGTDAVNLAQLQAATTAFGTTAAGLQNQVNGLQTQLNQTNFDLGQVRRRANGGTAGAMAVAGLPQAFEPGKSMIGGAVGYWQDQVAFAIGVSSIVGDHTVVKAGGSISNQGVGGFNAGIGFQF